MSMHNVHFRLLCGQGVGQDRWAIGLTSLKQNRFGYSRPGVGETSLHCKLDTHRTYCRFTIKEVKRIVRVAEDPRTTSKDFQDWEVAGVFVTEETMVQYNFSSKVLKDISELLICICNN